MENRKDTYQRKEKKDIIFGVHPVIEAVKSGQELNKVMIQRGIEKEHFKELKDALADKDYYIQYVPIEKLNTLTAGNHQGVVAFVTPIEYQNIETLIDKWVEEEKKPCILVLDRITDVRNFGAIARSAECQGVDAILIPSRGSALVTADAVRTSSGALSRIPVCKSENLTNRRSYQYFNNQQFKLEPLTNMTMTGAVAAFATAPAVFLSLASAFRGRRIQSALAKMHPQPAILCFVRIHEHPTTPILSREL